MRAQNASTMALSYGAPTALTDGARPASVTFWLKTQDANWLDSTGARNTVIVEVVLMGRPAGWMRELTGRAPMKSPGHPTHRREVERLFWLEVAKGLSSENAGIAVGASFAAGGRWFRERGGMPTFMLDRPLGTVEK